MIVEVIILILLTSNRIVYKTIPLSPLALKVPRGLPLNILRFNPTPRQKKQDHIHSLQEELSVAHGGEVTAGMGKYFAAF